MDENFKPNFHLKCHAQLSGAESPNIYLCWGELICCLHLRLWAGSVLITHRKYAGKLLILIIRIWRILYLQKHFMEIWFATVVKPLLHHLQFRFLIATLFLSWWVWFFVLMSEMAICYIFWSLGISTIHNFENRGNASEKAGCWTMDVPSFAPWGFEFFWNEIVCTEVMEMDLSFEWHDASLLQDCVLVGLPYLCLLPFGPQWSWYCFICYATFTFGLSVMFLPSK